MYRFLSLAIVTLALSISASATTPQLASLNPASGSGQSQTLTLTVSDSAAASDIGPVNLLINSTLNGATGCWIYFNHPGQFSLYSNGQWSAPASTGNTLSSSVCTVQLVSGNDSGTTSSVSFAITFAPSFAGNQTIWAAAADVEGDSTGYQQMGSFTVTATTPVTPTNVSVSPSNPTMYQNSPQTFTVVASDTTGAADLQGIHFLFKEFAPSPNGASYGDLTACWMWYQSSTNTLTMYDQGTWSAPAPLGSGGSVLTGDECTVDTSQASASASGNQLTLIVPVVTTVQNDMAIYMNAITNENSASDYQQMGTATVYPPFNNQGSFTVTFGGGGVVAPQGASPSKNAGYYVEVNAAGGFIGPVALSGNSKAVTSGNSSQLSFSFNPPTVQTQGTSSAVVSAAGATPDAYTVTVTGTSQTMSSTSQTATVYVDNAPPAVTLSAPTRTQSGITLTLPSESVSHVPL